MTVKSLYATCDECKRPMEPGGGCMFSHVQMKTGSPVKRIPVGDARDFCPDDLVCHDCNAGAGKYHHPGCDAERCPKCGGQMLGCLGDPDDPEMLELIAENPEVPWETCGWVYLRGPAPKK